MNDTPDFSAIGAITRGDEHSARRLRASLAVIARRTDDKSLRDLIVSVLAGNQSVRRVYEHRSFWSMFDTNLDNLQRGLDQLDDEQREDIISRVGVDRVDD